ncbi:MAG TPA: ABC transporter substrate-binding protein [Candidatus Sulfotelmatobacter sp.]|jgi:ABC-type transport system substrate-binding protein|nr:ABC transporter substrate-binding protein [Candidatus Sulfotelmatobacter sp.]
MAVIRKRLIFWLIKAYIKKSGKTIFFSFLFGLFVFFAMLFVEKYYSHIIPFTRTETIGLAGAYTVDSLPIEITNKMSYGLTTIAPDGTIQPGLASSWDVLDNGKTYRFHLKQNLHFYDGQEVNAITVNYNFSDVSQSSPDKFTIVYKLKDAYAPFLVTVSKPIFDRGFSGVGNYHLQKIDTIDNFVQSLTLVATKNGDDIINYDFYPTENALMMAYLLGEVSEIADINNIVQNNINLQKFSNTKITKKSNYSQLVTLFFNNNDGDLSNKKTRLALTYAVPNNFPEGKSAYLPYSPLSHYYNGQLDRRTQDLAHAKILLLPDSTSSLSGEIKPPSSLTIKTFKKYRPVAEAIAAAWKNLGITTKIEETNSMPNNYQIFLGEFNIPSDPDQYTLWHSDGPNNITHYKNLRIDKLLEDGRKTIAINKRKQIYADFQKFLLEDSPAFFLYYPDQYTITRK